MNIHTDAYSVTRACATSFQSAVNVAESIMSGTIDVGIAGGAILLLFYLLAFLKSLLRTYWR